MIRRLDSYIGPGRDIREHGDGAAMPAIFVVSLPGSGNAMYHAGYQEGKYGLLVALRCVMPLLSHLKATLEDD